MGPDLSSRNCSQNKIAFKFPLASSSPSPGCVFPDLREEEGEEYKKRGRSPFRKWNSNVRVPISESEVLKIPLRQPEEAVAVLCANKIDNSPQCNWSSDWDRRVGCDQHRSSTPARSFSRPQSRECFPSMKTEGSDGLLEAWTLDPCPTSPRNPGHVI